MHDLLSPLLAARAGLDPPAWALEARVRERATALGVSDEDYVTRAAADAAELDRLIELLRVGETRFFRHRAQLAALAERVLPTLRSPVAAWSAGCASGEEAWTLAMLLAERGVGFDVWATDLSAAALARARQGRYAAARVEADVPPALRARYFRRIGDDDVINDRLRAHVRFDAHNLLAATGGRELDLILCRNVLIYFDEARRAEVVARLVRALKPGGWLVVGYSEALRDQPELTAEAHAIYKKQLSAVSRQPSARAVAARTALASAAPVGVTPMPVAAPMTVPAVARVVLRGDYVDGKRLAAELRAVVGDARALLDLDGATFLGDDAARVLRRALEAAPALEVRATRPAIRRWLGRHGIRVR
ncbi:MAG TPA: protein-glutamate O-methyltransferase CheR [Polyangia bacterium]